MNNKSKFISACIIGKPNAGKSTLLNYLIGQKLSIVTHKVQTTRTIITGITHIKDMQIVFYDTPGLFEPKKKLEKAMVKCAWSSLNNADVILILLDVTQEIDETMSKILSFFKDKNHSVVFLLNKLDIISKNDAKNKFKDDYIDQNFKIDNVKNYLMENFSAPKIFEISALTGFGLASLQEYLYSLGRPAPWIYSEDEITTLPMKFLAAEITREQLFLNLHQELPYNLAVFTESWQEFGNNEVKINQTILVNKQNYKAMIIGKKGETLKRIGEKSRKEIDSVLDIKSHLFLFVKVEENWESSPALNEYTGLRPN